MKYISWKIYIIVTFLINFLLALVMLMYMDSQCTCTTYEENHMKYIYAKSEEHKIEKYNLNSSVDHLNDNIVIVIREFEYFENDIVNTITSILRILPRVKIFIISDNLPYPPILVDEYQKNVKIISLKSFINQPFELQHPLHVIEMDHIFIFPDSVILENVTQISQMLEVHYHNPTKIIAASIKDEESHCLSLNVSLRYWTMKYQKKVDSYTCNALQGTHILLVTKSLLMHLGFPFSKPFSTSLYIQATLRRVEVNPCLYWKNSFISFILII